ncbi:MAG: multicopper oxidase domain-containing protein [Bacteroidota bacterium]
MKTIIIYSLIWMSSMFIFSRNTYGQLPGSGQQPLEPSAVPQFVDPLPQFSGLRVNAQAGGHLYIKTVPHQQIAVSTGTVLATGTVGPSNPNVGLANFWTYSISKDGSNWTPPMWPAFTIEAQRGSPLDITFRNGLYGQTYASVGLTVDQSIMWASPMVTGNVLTDPYTGPVPICVHLHGGEVPSTSDGGPQAWFTPGYALKGSAFQQGVDSTYQYPNSQEAATLWYHEHTLGATRLNVYSGLAGFYFLRGTDEETDHLPGWSGDDLVKEVAPAGSSGTFNPNAYLPEIEVAIQDRMFDMQGGLFWPVDPPNPWLHPFWTPEFFGDIMTVNGKTWPYLSVAPRKYRFHFLDGCNASFLNMWLKNLQTGAPGPVITQIATDGGLLDSPVSFDPAQGKTLFLAPGERAEIVIDFSTVAPGSKWTLVTDARRPYPTGELPDSLYEGRIMQFVVNGEMVSASNPGNPGTDKSQVPSNLRATPLVKLTDFAGNLNVAPSVKRQLTLNESEGPGGPQLILVNNSRFDSMQGTGQFGQVTEKPVEGTSEIWQIVNLTMDAHPMHMHLVQFQLVSRQEFNDSLYMMEYNSGFPGYSWIAGAGPPHPYNTPNADGAVGGNPAVSSYTYGPLMYAEPNEKGWKDTFKCFPDQITTFIVRFCPTDKPVNTPPQNLLFDFDPSLGPGYVWHCHIVDHEDNEMMRPYTVIPSPYRGTGIPVAGNSAGYNLEQNHPNPLSGKSTIGYTIPVDQHIRIAIYNSIGIQVKVLTDAHASAGSHLIQFDGSELQEGVYLYRLEAGNYTASKKMVVIKSQQ